jgi:hypothetical protein
MPVGSIIPTRYGIAPLPRIQPSTPIHLFPDSHLEKIYNSKDYNDFMSQRGFGVKYAAGDAFLTFWTKSDEDLGAVMKKVGIAK